MAKKNKKNAKKNTKKVLAKNNISTTPVKAEGTKKEESKVPTKEEIAAAKKAAKAEHEKAKYAASEARKKARQERKKAAKDTLGGVKKASSGEQPKLSLEARKERQENRRKLAYNRHIASIQRRCKRMKLSDLQTQAIVNKAKSQWDSAKVYNLVIVYDFDADTTKEIVSLVRKNKASACCITGSTAFIKNVPKAEADTITEKLAGGSIYRYRVDGEDLFADYKANKVNASKKGGSPHSRECSKSRNINFYNLRRLKKAAKEAMKNTEYAVRHGEEANGRKARRLAADVKPVNKKPTQIKESKQKSAKKAA